ncbi:MAG TPA: cytochrome c family protein [Caulobacteraceae bacterium]|jgi:cytochrome c
MGGLQRNMIFGAVLTTAFVMAVLGVVVPMFFEPTLPTKPGYAIAVQETEGTEAPQPPPDWGTVLKTADVQAGQAKTAVCQSCHIFDAAGTNNIGPGLYGVLGRKPGTHPGFAYSPAMVAFGNKIGVWDYQHIFDFIAGPQKYIDGTKMTFIGMKDRQDRINVIAYLHTLGSTLPIPPPNPKAAAPAPGKAPPAGASNTAVGASNTATGGTSNTSTAGASNTAAAKPGK